MARYADDAVKFRARDRELFMESIKLCSTEFKDDERRRKACLDQVVPIKNDHPPCARVDGRAS
jgi:hypothetical protein